MSEISAPGIALITGASAGIGAVYADRLARRGHDLILVARNEERLNALAARLASETGRSVQAVPADLGSKAGLAPLVDADVDKMEEMIALNVTALTRLTYAAAPRLAARGSGTIINIASIVGISPEALNGVYGATKAYVIAFTHSLQHELAAKGLRIQAVLPGATATDLWEKAGRHHRHLPKQIVMSAEDMVDAALVGLDRGELVTIPPLQDEDEWTRWEAARRTLSQRFGHAVPAPRYGLAAAS